MSNSSLEQVYDWANNEHNKAGNTYDGNSYSKHLSHVLFYAIKYKSLIPRGILSDVFMACYCHDILEDTSNSYNDLKKVIGEVAADMVFNVTDELGKTRKERKAKTLPKIKSCKYSTFVKLMDRLANVEHSLSVNSRMFTVYQEEHAEFRKSLYTYQYKAVWDELDKLLGFVVVEVPFPTALIGCYPESECAFNSAGLGVQCETCRKYLHPGDKGYKEVVDYYKAQEGMR